MPHIPINRLNSTDIFLLTKRVVGSIFINEVNEKNIAPTKDIGSEY